MTAKDVLINLRDDVSQYVTAGVNQQDKILTKIQQLSPDASKLATDAKQMNYKDYTADLPDPADLRFLDTIANLKYTVSMQKGAKEMKVYDTFIDLTDGNYDRVRSITGGIVRDNMGATEKTIFDGKFAMMARMYLSYQMNEMDGMETNLVYGKLVQMANAFGLVGDPLALEFQKKIEGYIQQYTKSQTGAQFSYKEFERYAALFPQITDTKDKNRILIMNLYNTAVMDADMILLQSSKNFLADLRDVKPEGVWSLYGWMGTDKEPIRKSQNYINQKTSAKPDQYPKGTIVEVNGKQYISNGDGTFNPQ